MERWTEGAPLLVRVELETALDACAPALNTPETLETRETRETLETLEPPETLEICDA